VSLNLRVSFRALSSLVIGVITLLVMNKIGAAKELKISVRSLQRLAQSGVLKVVYKRGDSGKQEAVFDADDIAKYKIERDKPIDKLVPVSAMTKNDLARSNTLEFLDVFKNALTSRKSVVPIADKVLLTVQDCRALTGLSEQIIRDAIRGETLKARRIGRGFKVKRTDLDDFIDKL
jgi:excisionase family DNA binding protein